MMIKQFLLLIVIGIILMGCRAQEVEHVPYVQDRHTFVQEEHASCVQEGECTAIPPENLCPFTVDIYPEVLHVGDPLYVRLNFRNNTDEDTYAYARRSGSTEIEASLVEFYLKSEAIIPWAITHQGERWGMTPVWQKIAPGEDGLTQYLGLDFPGISLIGIPFFGIVRNYDEQWRSIRTSGTPGQLVVIINNGAGYSNVREVETDQFLTLSKQLRTVMSVSTPIVIRPRKQEEAALLETTNLMDRNAMRRIVPELTPGTLQNLLKYRLLLWNLKEGLHGETKMSEPQALKELEQIESFLKPLHDIERENLKRFADAFLASGGGRQWIERRMLEYGEQHLKRFIEVFGEKPAPFRMPSDHRGLGGGSSFSD